MLDMNRKATTVIIALVTAFLVLRFPVFIRQPGGMDEDCYAVPGLAILQSGIPKLLNAPARNMESVFYYADQALYAEPPLYFYWQAIFYAVLQPSYATARLSSCMAGLLGLFFLYRAQLIVSESRVAACWSFGLFLFSRWFYFAAASARPDVLCASFGFAAMLTMLWYRRSQERKWLLATGILIGLGGLTHPFALVYAIQMAVWCFIAERGTARITQPLILAAIAIATALLWLPLISLYPSIFAVQFKNQFLSSVGGSLTYRLLMPWESLWYHFLAPHGMVYHIGFPQFALAIIPLSIMTVRAHRTAPEWKPIVWLAWSGIPLLSVLVGPHHAVVGYWSYTAGQMFLCTGAVIQLSLERLGRYRFFQTREWLRVATPYALGLLATVALLPGSGLRATYTYVRHWNDINYNRSRFSEQLADSLPKDAICGVDPEFNFDFITMGVPTLLVDHESIYFRLQDSEYDYVILSKFGKDKRITTHLPLRLLRTVGVKEDVLACYAEIYERVR